MDPRTQAELSLKRKYSTESKQLLIQLINKQNVSNSENLMDDKKRPAPELELIQNKDKRQKNCRFFKQGFCKQDEKCQFRHEIDDFAKLPDQSKQVRYKSLYEKVLLN